MFEKGQKIRVTGNSIFDCMGMSVVTGTIFIIRGDNLGCSIECDQTGSIETLDFDDGNIEIV